jgi:protein associated with RNAse G/E
VRRKWPDGRHYEMAGRVLGTDDLGVWVGAERGSLVRMKDGSMRHGEHRVVYCVPHDGWYLVHLPDGGGVDVYVDICTPPVWGDDRATMIDLDFDVVVWSDAARGIELVDEDEFEEHRVALAYPDDLVSAARAAADTIAARVRAGEPPFTVAAGEPWLAMLGA